MNEPNRPRGFEDRLLREFKTYFDERNQTMTNVDETPEKTPRFGRATKFSFAGGIGAVALGIGAVVALPALTASPAYAVEEKDNGHVYIEVNSPEDAEGLEETLAEHGIKAKVDFPPDGKMCNPDRYEQAELPEDEWQALHEGTNAEGEIFLGFEVNPDHYALDGDTTLVIEINEGFFDGKAEANMIALGSADGEVGECDPVDHDLPVGGDEPEDAEEGEPMDEPLGGTHEEKDDDGSKSKNKD